MIGAMQGRFSGPLALGSEVTFCVECVAAITRALRAMRKNDDASISRVR
jgi:hypothetical protein